MEHGTTTGEERGNVNTPSIEMSERRISMGINVSILVILAIFGVLLSLPLRLLLNTNYYSRDEIVAAGNETSVQATGNSTVEEEEEIIPIPFDHKRLKRCPRFEYENTLKYIFKSDYDGNCTYDTGTSFATIGNDTVEEREGGKEKGEKEEEEEEKEGSLKEDGNEGRKEDTGTRILREIGKSDNKTDKVEESGEDRRSKSVLVAGHILVTMLLISAIAALVEVLRIRFARDKDSSKAGSISSRKTSTIELPIQRRFLPRYPMKSTKSFEMHRSAFRLLGARPPPLIRRSSFPIQQSKQSSGSISGTPNNRISRRQSAESDEEIGVLINALHHRTRLIRRH
ncbi:uncharacterized protein LOC100577092 [Apis mellifera]|uniref:Uncharacterized protein LOC100577092 n=1 Tax=Apis mellifera TaxID=7460 RepID=A0A7M7GSD5_APIME|nr:uncharacterized protein LOC100577092 [Apis mellifera]|eukprot:XP_006565118.2 uncharacterized protein LOC100577092 [Apis mellifera]